MCLIWNLKNIKQKKAAGEEKQKNKNKAMINDSLGVYSLDVQAVLLLPYLMRFSAYCKAKLKVCNYTVYNLINGEVNWFFFFVAWGQFK